MAFWMNFYSFQKFINFFCKKTVMLKPFTFFYSRNHKRSFYAVFILKIVKHGCLLVNVKKICLAKARLQMKCPVSLGLRQTVWV